MDEYEIDIVCRVAQRPVLYLEFKPAEWQAVLQLGKRRVLGIDERRRIVLGPWAQLEPSMTPNQLLREYVRLRRVAEHHEDPEQRRVAITRDETYSGFQFLENPQRRAEFIETFQMSIAQNGQAAHE